jgi:O-antigen ligase
VAARAQLNLPIHWAQAAVIGLAMLIGLLAGVAPMIAIGAAFAIAFVGVTLVNLTAGLCIFAVLTFVDSVIAEGSVVSLPKLMGALLVVSWLAYLTSHEGERRRLFEHPAFLYVLTLLVAWVLVSAAWAEHSGPVIETATRYLPNAILFLITYSAIQTRERALWLTGAFVVGTLISAAYGVVSPVDPAEGERLSGSVGNANETAAALVAGVPLAVALAVALKDPLLRVIAAIGVPLCLYATFLTLSRGGLVALVAVLFAGVAVAGRYRGRMIAAGLVGVLLCVGYFAMIATPEAQERVIDLQGGTGRTDIWKVGWRMVEDEPIIGIGAGNFPNSSVHYLLEPGTIMRAEFIVDEPKVAHNMYLEVLAESGIIGLALFLTVLGYALYCPLAARNRFRISGDRELEIVSAALFVSLVGLLASDFFGSRQFSKQLWLLMSMGPALLGLARMQLEERAERYAASEPSTTAS